MIKKFSLCILILCMVFLFFACTNTETITKENDVLLNNYDIDSEIYSSDNEKLSIEIKYPIIKNIEDKSVEKNINDNIALRVEEYKNLFYEDEQLKQSIVVKYNINKRSEEYLSITFLVTMSIEMAAHPSNFLDAVTFDLESGNELQLADLFIAGVDYKNNLNPILEQKINELDFDLFKEYEGIEEDQGFYLTDEELIIYYQEYIYTPHALGPLQLKIPLAEIRDIMVAK